MFRTFFVLLTIAILSTPALADRTTGVVKWYNAEKKYGFLAPSSGGPDVFVHSSGISASCHGTLQEGQAVEFDIVEVGQGKWAAKDVTCR